MFSTIPAKDTRENSTRENVLLDCPCLNDHLTTNVTVQVGTRPNDMIILIFRARYLFLTEVFFSQVGKEYCTSLSKQNPSSPRDFLYVQL